MVTTHLIQFISTHKKTCHWLHAAVQMAMPAGSGQQHNDSDKAAKMPQDPQWQINATHENRQNSCTIQLNHDILVSDSLSDLLKLIT